jgi:hypothetical protein
MILLGYLTNHMVKEIIVRTIGAFLGLTQFIYLLYPYTIIR